MRRRTWLRIGIGGAALLALGGGTLALVRPGWSAGRLTPAGRELFAAVARGVLAGTLSDRAAQPMPHARMLAAHLERLQTTIAALPAPTQQDIAELAAVLLHPLGRRLFAGLATDWRDASPAELQATLQRLRISSLTLRQQAFHALRDLTNGAFFAGPGTWEAIGYPGPRPI
ncbi:MAG TPA: hypothetical protein PLZ50_08855 [Rubrivivax sp.]|jgi:hypothetical protein|nr:hypothetical protein [Pseudomonadota bacterium]HPP83657.1 hypothetical protein [Rubrivivax sp.]